MKKNMYKQPIVETTKLITNTFVMITVSEGEGGGGGSIGHTPGRKGDIIP